MFKKQCNFFRKVIYFFQKIKKNTKQLKKMFEKNKQYHQYLNFDICFEKKSEIFLETFFSTCFSNFCQFPEIHWDKYDGDVGGDSDGDGQLWGPKLTETIANIYQDLGKI